MKKFLLFIATLLCLTGCVPVKEDVPLTMGEKIETVFADEAKEDILTIAQDIIDELGTEYQLDIMNVNPGYLPGFVQDIAGFEEGVLISPIVGTIPFVCYIFKTETPEQLMESLENFHDMRWNICTEADEKVASTKGNYVLFAMIPADN